MRRVGTIQALLCIVIHTSKVIAFSSALRAGSLPNSKLIFPTGGSCTTFPASSRQTAGRGLHTTSMIVDKIAALQTANIILASGSPRRQEILNTILKLGVKIMPSTFEENLDKSQFTPASYVQENARQKALEVWNRLKGGDTCPDLIIGSDTVVAHDGRILEKPRDEGHAVEMLRDLSGNSHEVFSGVALLYNCAGSQPSERCFVEATDVTFAKLEDSVIKAYVASGEPMDKAGGYGIQEVGGSFVSGIKGDYFNVMGFPMHAFCRELSSLIEQGHVISTDASV